MVLQHGEAGAGIRQVAFVSEELATASVTPPPAYAQHTGMVLRELAGSSPEEAQLLIPGTGEGR
jgi:hypothetical protein